MNYSKLLAFVAAFSGTVICYAQSIELRPIAAYTFQETFPVNSGNVRVNDGAMYGIALAYILEEKVDINLSYQIQTTTLDINRYPSFLGDKGNNASISYYELGLNRNHVLQSTDKIIPYSGIKLGIAYLNMKDGRYEDVTRAALGLNVGAKVMFNNRIGLNLFALLQSPISGIGLTVSGGSGGVSTGVGTYSYVMQFSLGGGLVFKLK